MKLNWDILCMNMLWTVIKSYTNIKHYIKPMLISSSIAQWLLNLYLQKLTTYFVKKLWRKTFIFNGSIFFKKR